MASDSLYELLTLATWSWGDLIKLRKIVFKVELYICVVKVAKLAAINLESNCISVSFSLSELQDVKSIIVHKISNLSVSLREFVRLLEMWGSKWPVLWVFLSTVSSLFDQALRNGTCTCTLGHCTWELKTCRLLHICQPCLILCPHISSEPTDELWHLWPSNFARLESSKMLRPLKRMFLLDAIDEKEVSRLNRWTTKAARVT